MKGLVTLLLGLGAAGYGLEGVVTRTILQCGRGGCSLRTGQSAVTWGAFMAALGLAIACYGAWQWRASRG